jgi:hypothetical protein
MGYELYVEREAGLARVSLFGQNSVEQHLQWINDLVSNPNWLPGFDVLVDTRGLTNPDLPYQQVCEIAQYVKRLNERLGAGRHAVVGDTDLLFRYCRMAEQLCLPCSRDILVFRDVEAARRWLGMEEEEEPSRHSAERLRKARGEAEPEGASAGRK